jgi:hypothetical protein
MMLNAATFESLKQWICALTDPLTFQKKMEMLDCEMQEHKICKASSDNWLHIIYPGIGLAYLTAQKNVPTWRLILQPSRSDDGVVNA